MATQSGTEKCELCEAAFPNLHCNTCRMHLCPKCVSEHTLSQPTLKHSITGFELRDTGIKQMICASHTSFNCYLHCEKCMSPICAQCCTETHQGHRVTDIADQYKTKLKEIVVDNHNLHRVIREYENIISEIQNEIMKLTDKCQQLKSSVSVQGQIWHEEIDKIIKNYQTEIDVMETNGLSVLNQHLSEMESCIAFIRKTKDQNLETMKHKDGKELVKYRSTSRELKQIPSGKHVTPPQFKATDISSHNFGSLSTPVISPTNGYVVEMILDIPLKVTNIITGYAALWGLNCTSTDEVWVIFKKWGSSDIKRIDLRGSHCETVSILSGDPQDLTVTKQGDLVYTVLEDGGVSHVDRARQGKIETIITLHEWAPRGLCSTTDGDLLVCMNNHTKSKVVRYCGSSVTQEIMNDEDGQHLYGTGDLFITENTFKDIWVSDHKTNSIVVTDQSGKFKFRYADSLESKNKEPFCPWCIDSDRYGHVLAIDVGNNCIHIIDQNGNLICLIGSLNDPKGICVDKNHHVWIGESDGKVEILKYIE